jgi:ERCC4-related helicase
MISDYHAKYFAHELTRRCPSDSVQKLAATLADAQVDLNPHQIDAALFAFRSPLSKGAILADEVGLGKTIEAGILLSQKWAERKRKLLIIVPASLRKQWSQELADKFFLPSAILEARTFNDTISAGNLNPFDQPQVVICSYHFARSKEPYIRQVQWDLVVVDEAHRLRNVYKPTNRIANALKTMLAPFPKVLLTATPLQNSLMELYGLVGIVDEYVFGDQESYRRQFSGLAGDADFAELRKRLEPVCRRTLRRQVLEYVKYTNRIPLTQEFYPTEQEQQLYDLVSDYLQRDEIYALPSSQRKLMTLILRRLLASSTYAITGTLEALTDKLETVAQNQTPVDAAPEEISPDYEAIDELEEEWEDEEGVAEPGKVYSATEMDGIHREIADLKRFSELAKSILKNSKGEVLLTALEKGFAKARDMGAPEKAVIFTESRRTQEYLRQLLENSKYAGRLVLFNGSNTDYLSKGIYQEWLDRNEGSDRVSGSKTADMRAALVEYFRDKASILIATEAAAEGINLQFCPLVVNYDLPWNPQRIEQRIGRCHRYGQKYDVVVINFLNKKNAADLRVFELLDEKFQLFKGVFGASDGVLGVIESGVDFEKRIADIYQTCRTPEQIEFSFNKLRDEMEADIADAMSQTRKKLLENFDEEVQEKLRLNRQESEEYLDRFGQWLWAATQHTLKDHATFDDPAKAFQLTRNPFPGEVIHPGPYRMGRNVEDANIYRVGHPLAQRIIQGCLDAVTPATSLVFDYSRTNRKIAVLEPLVGQSGWLRLTRLTATAFETEDFLIFSGVTDKGVTLELDHCRRLFTLDVLESPSAVQECDPAVHSVLSAQEESQRVQLLKDVETKNSGYFGTEMDKLDRWGEDQRDSLKRALHDMDRQINELGRSARVAPNLPEKLRLEREKQQLGIKRDEAWKEYDKAAKEIEGRKSELLDGIQKKLENKPVMEQVFTIRWALR